eukprot:6462923-Amphidinium_carterae.2
MHVQSTLVAKPADDDVGGADAGDAAKAEEEEPELEDVECDAADIGGVPPQRLKAVNKNILAASRICASPLSRRLFLLLCELPVPVMDWFDKMLHAVKNPDDSAALMCGLAGGSLVKLMRSTAAWFVSKEFAQRLQFTETPKGDAAGKVCEQVAASALTLFVSSVGEWSVTSTSWTAELPGAFLRLLSSDTTLRAQGMEYLRRVWVAVTNLEEESARKPSAATYHMELKWSTMEWVREILMALAAHSWCLTDAIRDAIVGYSRAWWSSVLAENTLRHARSRDGAPSGKSGMLRTYHHLCRGCGLASAYGRTGIEADDAPHAGGQSDLTDEFFEVDMDVMSLPSSSVDRLLENPASYPKLSSRGVREAGIRTLCMVHNNGSMEQIEQSFWSKLLMPGHIVSQKEANSGYLVFYSSRYGALAMKVGLSKRDGHAVLSGFFEPTSEMEYLCVKDISDWRTMPTKCLAPGIANLQFLREQGLQIVPGEKKGVALPVCAMHCGMPGWTVPLLKRLWRELPLEMYPIPARWKGRSVEDSGESEIMSALAERVLKTDCED